MTFVPRGHLVTCVSVVGNTQDVVSRVKKRSGASFDRAGKFKSFSLTLFFFKTSKFTQFPSRFQHP